MGPIQEQLRPVCNGYPWTKYGDSICEIIQLSLCCEPSLSTTYYDPSYGVKAESIEVYTPMAIGAWSIPYAGDLLWAPQEEDPQRVLIEYGE